MKHLKLFAMLISALVGSAGSAIADQPPDVVTSDDAGNTAMGTSALANLAGGFSNTAAGSFALFSNTTGAGNSAFGPSALKDNTTGIDNTAIGAIALADNSVGSDNTASGVAALLTNTTGDNNTAIGYQALLSNTTANNNTALGDSALYSNTTGGGNTASGNNALYSNTTGAGNTASGIGALLDNTTGQNNTASGYGALQDNSTGSNNIALGYAAGVLITGSNNIDIGNKGVATDNGFIRIGTKGTHKATVIEGIYTTALEANSLPVFVNAAGRLSVGTSSERYKTAIAPMGKNSQKMQQLRPVTFRLKTDPTGAPQYGLIAEEVAKVYPELVIRDESGKIRGIRYDELAPMLLNELQAQQQQLRDLQREMMELKAGRGAQR